MKLVKIIAEVANAHQGDVGQLHELVVAASVSGADAIKFQWFRYDALATPDYQWYQVYKDLFIEPEVWSEVVSAAKKIGLEVWVDVFDTWGLKLAQQLDQYIDGYKLPPTVMQMPSLGAELVAMEKPLLIGVGGWYDQEISQALTTMGAGPDSQLVLMHGFQGYPTQTKDAALSRIRHLMDHFQRPVGFADHEDAAKVTAIDMPAYAVAAGAEVLEKHLTLDRSVKGYDYYSSLEPAEFATMVGKIRQLEQIFGDSSITESQRAYLKDALRVVATQNLEAGELVTAANTASKRCPTEAGLLPVDFFNRLPAVVRGKVKKNQAITDDILSPPKIAIAVICRLKSTRLREKALLPINGVASIERCLLNCLAVRGVDSVVLATSDLPDDDPLAKVTLDGRVKVLRGDPENVAMRMVQAADLVQADIILRVTGDCPVVSPEILEYLIASHFETGADFTAPTNEHAIGTAGDVYTVAAIRKLLGVSVPLAHTEYLSFYFRNNPKIFSINDVVLPQKWRKKWRLTLDEPRDLDMFQELFSGLKVGFEPTFFTDVIKYFERHEATALINESVSLKWRDNTELVEAIKIETKIEDRFWNFKKS